MVYRIELYKNDVLFKVIGEYVYYNQVLNMLDRLEQEYKIEDGYLFQVSEVLIKEGVVK